MKIGCSGQVNPRSGIGVVQRYLYSYLTAAGHELVFSKPRDVGTSAVAKVRGLVRGLKPASGPVDVYLSVVPPLPYGLRGPVLTIVHDLRWSRTRSTVAAAYRAWDMHRTMRRSDALACVSETTRRELLKFDPRAVTATVQRLGPGLVPEGSFHDNNSGLVMLVGSAPHKRNELAADALAFARPPWISGVIGVGVSDHVRAALSEEFACEWFSDVSNAQMVALYQRAEFFLMLGTDEGFGLPFVEALAAGCQVIATDHPLTREIVGAAGLLITSGDAADVGRQLLFPPLVSAQVRTAHASRYSWSRYGEACEAELVRIIEARRGCHVDSSV